MSVLSKHCIIILATGFGTGFSPYAPGTLGTLLGIPVYFLLAALSPVPRLMVLFVGIVAAIYVSGRAELLLQEKDSSRIVIDEIIGFQIAMLFSVPSLIHLVTGFALFRFFDICKPFPVRFCEKTLPGGFGVVGDDVFAGLYVLGILYVLNLSMGI